MGKKSRKEKELKPQTDNGANDAYKNWDAADEASSDGWKQGALSKGDSVEFVVLRPLVGGEVMNPSVEEALWYFGSGQSDVKDDDNKAVLSDLKVEGRSVVSQLLAEIESEYSGNDDVMERINSNRGKTVKASKTVHFWSLFYEGGELSKKPVECTVSAWTWAKVARAIADEKKTNPRGAVLEPKHSFPIKLAKVSQKEFSAGLTSKGAGAVPYDKSICEGIVPYEAEKPKSITATREAVLGYLFAGNIPRELVERYELLGKPKKEKTAKKEKKKGKKRKES